MHVCMILSSLPKCTNILFQDDSQDATRLLILDAFRDVIRSACPRLPGHVQYVVNHVVVLALDVTSQHYANSNFTRDVSWIWETVGLSDKQKERVPRWNDDSQDETFGESFCLRSNLNSTLCLHFRTWLRNASAFCWIWSMRLHRLFLAPSTCIPSNATTKS